VKPKRRHAEPPSTPLGAAPLTEEIRARILHQDTEVLILDKPAGLAVHGGPRGGASLEDWLPALRQGKRHLPQPAHRLDADTAGCLALGRTKPSIAALNAKLLEQGEPAALDARRFRANIWLDGVAPHEEDSWGAIQLGSVTLGMGSLCLRCVLTTVDPDTLDAGTQPLRAFAEYRRTPDGVVFGVNATHAGEGTIAVGDGVVVLAER
jgi:uncharacterized protein YcbX